MPTADQCRSSEVDAMFRSLVESLFGRKRRPSRHQKKGPPARSRLRLEALEDRWVPANPTVNLDQWADLPTASWQNGNLGASNSLYAEGQFVPFRLVMTNLVA